LRRHVSEQSRVANLPQSAGQELQLLGVDLPDTRREMLDVGTTVLAEDLATCLGDAAGELLQLESGLVCAMQRQVTYRSTRNREGDDLDRRRAACRVLESHSEGDR